MTLTELDTLRADTMRTLLNPVGQQEIWKYDIVPSRDAFAMALDDWNFDGIERGGQAQKDHQQYALIGAGIEDHHFTTPEELIRILEWLCRDGGYLSCYRVEVPTT